MLTSLRTSGILTATENLRISPPSWKPALLILTALYIIYEAFSRLFFHSVHIQPSLTAILVLCAALAIDFTRARALNKVAAKHISEALEADALHFSTDVWSTIVVILGVALVWAGNFWNLPWLSYADSLAALAVAGVILWLSSQLGRRTLDALLDAAPEGLQNEITGAIGQMDGVLRVERVRVRRAGNRHFVDATVAVPRATNLERVHALTDAIEKRVSQIVPADVVVHTEPRAPDNEDLFESIQAVAQRMGHPIHDISAYQQGDNLFVELHLEVDENLSSGRSASASHGTGRRHPRAWAMARINSTSISTLSRSAATFPLPKSVWEKCANWSSRSKHS